MAENSKIKLKVNTEGLYELASDGEEFEAKEAVCLSLTDSARYEIVNVAAGERRA